MERIAFGQVVRKQLVLRLPSCSGRYVPLFQGPVEITSYDCSSCMETPRLGGMRIAGDVHQGRHAAARSSVSQVCRTSALARPMGHEVIG